MLVSGAASGQERLAQAAQSSAKTITQLTDVVKLGAASIGSDDPETQVRLFQFLIRSWCLLSGPMVEEWSTKTLFQSDFAPGRDGISLCILSLGGSD